MFLQFPFLKQSDLCQVLTVLQSLSFSQIAVKLFLDPYIALFFLQNVLYLEVAIYSDGCNHLFIYIVVAKLLKIACRRLISLFLTYQGLSMQLYLTFYRFWERQG